MSVLESHWLLHVTDSEQLNDVLKDYLFAHKKYCTVQQQVTDCLEFNKAKGTPSCLMIEEQRHGIETEIYIGQNNH